VLLLLQAIHFFNIKQEGFALRYMVVVVPDIGPGSPLSVEDIEHTTAVLNTAGNHKTILAATRTQAIQLLELMR
jgi:hypothetical protein